MSVRRPGAVRRAACSGQAGGSRRARGGRPWSSHGGWPWNSRGSRAHALRRPGWRLATWLTRRRGGRELAVELAVEYLMFIDFV